MLRDFLSKQGFRSRIPRGPDRKRSLQVADVLTPVAVEQVPEPLRRTSLPPLVVDVPRALLAPAAVRAVGDLEQEWVVGDGRAGQRVVEDRPARPPWVPPHVAVLQVVVVRRDRAEGPSTPPPRPPPPSPGPQRRVDRVVVELSALRRRQGVWPAPRHRVVVLLREPRAVECPVHVAARWREVRRRRCGQVVRAGEEPALQRVPRVLRRVLRVRQHRVTVAVHAGPSARRRLRP